MKKNLNVFLWILSGCGSDPKTFLPHDHALEQPHTILKAPETQEDVFANYDEKRGQKVAQYAEDHQAGRPTGTCYAYVAAALGQTESWPAGFHSSASCVSTDLNCRYHAKSFAKHWHTPTHSTQIPYKPFFLKKNKNHENISIITDATQAPVGSILVWSPCTSTSSVAGHIAIVTQKGERAVADFAGHPNQKCNPENLIGIFVPVKNP